MKAFGYRKCLAVTEQDFLLEEAIPVPVVSGRDLLVEIKAISVNPVDAKVRKRAEPAEGQLKVLGWDATGIVKEVGPDVKLFKPGDEVWYAGSIARPGANAEFQLVDERIVSLKPSSLSFAEAAALPLTSITAWELLFDRLEILAESRGDLLVIGAAGGVGSILIQLAKQRTSLNVIGTASRQSSQDWVKSLGADVVIDHSKDFGPQLEAAGIKDVKYVASLTHTGDHFEQIAEVIAPQGRLCLIDDPAEPLNLALVKWKSVSVHWEFMFTRSLYETADMQAQHELLSSVAAMVDEGKVKTTVGATLGKINLENLKEAHRMIESEKSIGKIVLEGFE
ncbi:MAG: zinc-binding alcohol dehydrogenase family protein [Lentisphaeraceae bacterium]|nr:zinc-binding alcohol dehydrogenase family protein [Lentisphaeraceae bacterium]